MKVIPRWDSHPKDFFDTQGIPWTHQKWLLLPYFPCPRPNEDLVLIAVGPSAQVLVAFCGSNGTNPLLQPKR